MNYDTTIRQWLAEHHVGGNMLGTFEIDGVKVMKNPVDIAIYMQLVYTCKPRTIIEIGSRFGGSALLFKRLLDSSGIEGRTVVISIDISKEAICQKARSIPGLFFLTGNSSDPAIAKRADRLAIGRVMVIHDGGHHKEQVLADLRLYAPMVSRGQYFVVEDTIMDTYPGKPIGKKPGPLAAVREFLKGNNEFEIDPYWHRYVITYNPWGYLKRVR